MVKRDEMDCIHAIYAEKREREEEKKWMRLKNLITGCGLW